MTDDLSIARGKRIARERTTEEIRDAIRKFQSECLNPACRRPLRDHSDAELDTCAVAERDQFHLPEGA